MKNLKFIVVALFFAMTAMLAVAAETAKPTSLTLPTVVGDNMVLQQQADVNVWGWAKPKSKVVVTAEWDAKPVAVKADANGKWIATLHTPKASYSPTSVKIVAGKESRTLTNILIGEVWLCSGQSNMQFKVRQSLDYKKDLKKEMNTNIRIYNTGRISNETEQEDVADAKWSACNPTDLAEFSAVGYGFGKDLQKKLDVPIGLICASYGGTYIEGWLKKSVIEADQKIVADCKAIKKTWVNKESHLYNANIYPIRHTTVAGVIWYQGCSNASVRPRNYGYTLTKLISSWREEFRNAELPFYLVQIAPHTYQGIKGAQLRECQARVAKKAAHCEYVPAIDQQEIPGDIHPRFKADLAHRLANCALGEHYGFNDIDFRCPAYKSMEVDGNAIRIRVKNVPTSLVARGDRINGFQIGVTSKTNATQLDFVLAEARIEADNSIVVWADGVVEPEAVRYCFNEDVGNVFSAEGLPLAPFRTDKNNRSVGARPYVEAPSQIAITFEGKGYTRSTFTKGAHMWPNLKQTLSDNYPAEFEGFQMLTAPSRKNEKTPGGTITAEGDGRVYCIVRTTKDMVKIAQKKRWNIMTSTYLQAETPEGKKISNQYIAYADVKAGDKVELPSVKDHYSVFVLAKEINYAE